MRTISLLLMLTAGIKNSIKDDYVMVWIHHKRYPKNSFKKLHAPAIGPDHILQKFGWLDLMHLYLTCHLIWVLVMFSMWFLIEALVRHLQCIHLFCRWTIFCILNTMYSFFFFGRLGGRSVGGEGLMPMERLKVSNPWPPRIRSN